MGGIPLLNDNQMNSLRRILGTNQKLNLTVSHHGKTRKLPSFEEESTASSGGVVLAMIMSGDSTSGYTVHLYANGKESASTGTGTVFLPEVALTGSLPLGTWVLAHLSEVVVTGGNDA